MVTVSEKRNRVYQRRFDHDEARRLHEEDPARWSYTALAERFGVSRSAISRVVDEERGAYVLRQTREYARRQRRPCLGGCGALVWRHGRSGLCIRCLHASRTENVRADSLRCTACGEWKPDEEFWRRPSAVRRDRSAECRSCGNDRRQRDRLRAGRRA